MSISPVMATREEVAGRAEAVQGEHAAGEGEWGGQGANWGMVGAGVLNKREGMRHKVVRRESPGAGGTGRKAWGERYAERRGERQGEG